jgi:DNA-binding response OmpR family regulator
MRVLFVGKHPDEYAAIWRKLGLQGVDVAFATSQAQAAREAGRGQPDAIIVDGGSLGSRGRRVCGALRRAAPLASIILIGKGAPGGPEDRAVDVRLQPPVAWQMLAGLLEKPKTAAVVVCGPFKLCISSRTLAGPFGEARLSPVLCDLMACFMRHPGEVLTRQVIMGEVWRTAYVGDTRTLDVHVSWLRKIVEPEPAQPVIIVTQRGVGYMFVPGDDHPVKPLGELPTQDRLQALA